MLKGKEVLSVTDFNKGLNTKANILANEKGQSPNTMNIKWNFDGSIQRRLGASSTNSVRIGSTTIAGWTLDTQSDLTTNLEAYWKMEEPSGSRVDQINNIALADTNGIVSITGIRGQAASFVQTNSQFLSVFNTSVLATTGNFTVSTWVMFDTRGVAQTIASINDNINTDRSWALDVTAANSAAFYVSTGGGFSSVTASSFGAINTSTWYNIIGWYSQGSHIGISINLSVNTAPFTAAIKTASTQFCVGAANTAGSFPIRGRVDEVGYWKKILSSANRADIYGNGTGNTYSAGQSGFGWAMFDFGASSIRWLTVAAGTGIYASSNMGTNFVAVGTTRTQNYQYFDRSKNVLIATSDSYDVPLYWAGSATTFFAALAPNSAPSAKFSINHQGFLILLNSSTRKRGFYYNDENTQLTSTWSNNFDLPSSADDEITAAFLINRILYVSTKYRIFKVSYIGGNPDWQYEQVKDWGYVPRTVCKATIKSGEVVVGLDWNRRKRIFDGSDDLIISDNVESDNMICDFAMQKISYAGSGLVVSNAVFDTLEQEYRLCVSVGAQSDQTTHAIILNARTLSLYPYDNQVYQAMCMAESNNQLHLMAVDRSGFVHILNSGNTDVAKPIDDIYESPFMFKTTPGSVQKSDKLDLFFAVSSAGNVYFKDRVEFSSIYGSARKIINLNRSKSVNHIVESIDIPSTQNIYQYMLTSSMGTAEPWKLTHTDYYFQTLGIGKGN